MGKQANASPASQEGTINISRPANHKIPLLSRLLQDAGIPPKQNWTSALQQSAKKVDAGMHSKGNPPMHLLLPPLQV
jgi:hypothetical protein